MNREEFDTHLNRMALSHTAITAAEIAAQDGFVKNMPLVKLLDSASPELLWFIAKEADNIRNYPIVNLVALAALKARIEYRKQQTINMHTHDFSPAAYNTDEFIENYGHVYDRVAALSELQTVDKPS